MHLNCTGEGSPTVILEALSGGFSSYWGWVQEELAQTTRVCSYDRAGRAWSEEAPAEQDLWQTAASLHTLLQQAGEPGPYVLVGHSIGGLYTRAFIDQYGDEVAGLVLLDSAHPEQYERDPSLGEQNRSYLQLSAIFPLLARIGLFRLYFASGGEIDFGDLAPRQHDEVAMAWSSPDYFNSQRAEGIRAEQIYTQAQSLGSLGDLPLIVITAGEGSTPTWLEFQTELAGLSSDSLHTTLTEANHASLVFSPEHATSVSQLIQEVVAAVREGAPLAE
jgi:pimeloyl-ACP methyl ester carboxylesterase